MKKIAAALAAIGALCMMTATGRDDMMTAGGSSISMTALAAWTIGGILCLGAAWALYEKNERRQ